MFRSYFKVAFRNLVKSKGYSFINITGLAIGMAVAILIGLWIYDEISFDNSFANKKTIARVVQNVTNNGQVQTWTAVPFPLAEELRKNYGSDFKHVVMGGAYGDHLITIRDKKLKQKGGYFENGFAEMFSLKMLRANWSAMKEPASVLLSASAARAWFATEDPINKLVQIDNHAPVKVTGVYENMPHNSSFEGTDFITTWNFFYSINNGFKDTEDPWRPNFTTLYVQVYDPAENLRIK